MFGQYTTGFRLVDANNRQIRPGAAGAAGTSITPGASNAMGSYTELLASSADDCHGIEVVFNSDTGSTRAKLFDIAIGAGGSEIVILPNLVCGPVPIYQSAGNVVGGARYFFPVFVKAGTRFAARAQVNNATAGTCNVIIRLYKANRPDMLRCGSRVIAYGVDTANSRGTAITEGTASDGTYVELGTIAAGERPFHWNLGITYDAATKAARAETADLAIGPAGDTSTAGKRLLVEDKPIAGTTTPQINVPVSFDVYARGLPGESLYSRQQSSGAAETGFYHAAYGVV